MRPLRFGVVGCGAISTLHQLPALRRCRELELAAVVDADGSWAAAVARRFGAAESFADHHALIGRVDAALVATPNHTHADITCDLLAGGVHVLCEKPMATTRAEVDCMLEAASRCGRRLMAGHCLRFSPNLAMLKRIIEAGWLGEIIEMSGALGGPYEASARRTDFRRQKACAGGGVLVDLGVHLIDLAVWFAAAAPREVVYDQARQPGWEVETDAEVGLGFADGSRAVLTASFTHPQSAAFTVRGSGGWATAPLYQPDQLTVFSSNARICRQGGVQQLQVSGGAMYDEQVAHFCAAVRAEQPFLILANEIVATIDVIERCYRRPQADAA
jgi:predicted dehydrogenase